MAAEVLSNIAAALSTTFGEELRRQWNREAVLASVLPTRPTIGQGGGKQIAWNVLFSGNAAASFAEGSDIQGSEYNYDPAVPAVLSYGQYRTAFQISNLEINAAAASPMQARELGRIVLERVFDGLAKIASVANTDLFTGTGVDGSGNPNIIGLGSGQGTSGALVTSGSYAGINTATFAEWKANLLVNGGNPRALTLDLLANLEQLIFTASGEEPDLIVTSPGVYRKYEDLFTTAMRLMLDGRGPMSGFNGSTPVGTLFWRGKPILRDRNCPAGTLYMLNTRKVIQRVLPWQPLTAGINTYESQLPSTNGEDVKATAPIPCMVYPLGLTGSGVKWVAETYFQLSVERPNTCGYISDISEV